MRSIITKHPLTLIVIALVSGFLIVALVFFSMIASSFVENAYLEKLREKADLAEEINDFVSSQQGELIYTFTRPKKRSDFISAELTTDNEYIHGIKSTQFVNQIFSKFGSSYDVRITSHSPINPVNMASKVAQDKVEDWKYYSAKNSKDEYHRVENGEIILVRPSYAKESCVVCHGSYSNAPEYVRAAFPQYNANPLDFSFGPPTGFGIQKDHLIGFLETKTKFPSWWLYLYEFHFKELLIGFLLMGLILWLLFDCTLVSVIRKFTFQLFQYSTSRIIDVSPDDITNHKGELGQLSDSITRVALTIKEQNENLDAKNELLDAKNELLGKIHSATEKIDPYIDGKDDHETMLILKKLFSGIRREITKNTNTQGS